MTSITTPIACIYGFGMFFFSAAFLVDWLRTRRQIRPYLRYGVWAGLALVGLDLLTAALVPAALSTALILALFLEVFVFIRVVGFTMLGMHYCTMLGYPSFPLFIRRFGVPSLKEVEPPEVVPDSAPAAMDTVGFVAEPLADKPEETLPDAAPPAPAASRLMPVLLQVSRTKYLASILAVALIGTVYTVGLFLLIKPHVSETAQRALGFTTSVSENTFTLPGIMVVLTFALGEEIFFRLGIQNFLAARLHLQDGRYWVAIVLTSVLWTAGHVGTLDPEWVKLAQVFPVGLMLGWLFKKYGAESTILAHGLFNVLLLIPAPYLIT